jgi:hypothetical protein
MAEHMIDRDTARLLAAITKAAVIADGMGSYGTRDVLLDELRTLHDECNLTPIPTDEDELDDWCERERLIH